VADAKTHVIESIARNRRATYDYELSDKFEAGLVLLGTEVKTLRDGQADLSGSFVAFQRGEAWLKGVNIPEMQGTPYSHDGKRARKLLLNRREIEKMQRAVDRDGMTVVATLQGREVAADLAGGCHRGRWVRRVRHVFRFGGNERLRGRGRRAVS